MKSKELSISVDGALVEVLSTVKTFWIYCPVVVTPHAVRQATLK